MERLKRVMEIDPEAANTVRGGKTCECSCSCACKMDSTTDDTKSSNTDTLMLSTYAG